MCEAPHGAGRTKAATPIQPLNYGLARLRLVRDAYGLWRVWGKPAFQRTARVSAPLFFSFAPRADEKNGDPDEI